MVELSSLIFLAASMLSILPKNLLIAELIKLIVKVEESSANILSL